MSETVKKIIIESEIFNEIMRVCSPAVSKDEVRKQLQFIEIQCNGLGEGCATALDGYMMSQIRFHCQGDACKGLIPPRKKVKKIKSLRFAFQSMKPAFPMARKQPSAKCLMLRTI